MGGRAHHQGISCPHQLLFYDVHIVNSVMSKEVPFVDWEPAITPEEVFSDIIGLNEIHVVGKRTYWVEMRPVERGRCVVV